MSNRAAPAAPLLLALLCSLAGSAQGGARYAPGELLVKFRGTSSHATRTAAEGALRARVLHAFSSPGLEQLELPPGVGVEEAAARLRLDPSVEYAEPNYEIRAAAVPSDSLFMQMWSLHNTGQTG